MKTIRTLAFDFGASSGRAILGEYDGERVTLQEVHRFPNEPVEVNGALYWDVLRLFHELKQGISAAAPVQIGNDFDLLWTNNSQNTET